VSYEVDFSGFSVDEIEEMKLEQPQDPPKKVEGKSTMTPPIAVNTQKMEYKVELKEFKDYKQAIIDYLNAALNDKPSVIVVLEQMRTDIGMNPKTLFKHLKALRQTHFTLTNLGYGTQVRKKE
jgi:hypothetical protein